MITAETLRIAASTPDLLAMQAIEGLLRDAANEIERLEGMNIEMKRADREDMARAMKQQALMTFDPATGETKPYPSHAEQWREYHGYGTAWLFNPWTGGRRHAGDVGTDVLGRLIQPPTEPLYAAHGDSCGAQQCQGINLAGGSAQAAELGALMREQRSSRIHGGRLGA